MSNTTKVCVSLQFTHCGEQTRLTRTVLVPVNGSKIPIFEAKRRIDEMITRRYDGMAQPPMVSDDHTERIVVNGDHLPDPLAFFDAMTAAAADTVTVN